MNWSHRRTRILLQLVFSMAMPAAYAQMDAEVQRRAEQEAERQQQRERLQRQEEQRRRRHAAPDVRFDKQPDSQDLSFPEEAPCFTFTHFVIDLPPQLSALQKRLGASALPLDPFHFLRQELDTYRGRCIGQAGINLLQQRLSSLILKRAYSTTRLGIPEQDLSSGIFTLTLIPGVVRSIHFDDDVPVSWKSAFPARPGELLNLRELEQGLEQLKRIPSHDASMRIVPGALPGESDIVIDIRRSKPWKVSVSLDNNGAKTTGRLQSGIIMALDNPLGLNDLFHVGLNTDVDREGEQHGTTGNSLGYSLPYGYWTFGLNASTYRYHQRIAGLYQQFVSSGQGQNLEVKFNYLFQRDRQQKNQLQFKIGKRWNRAYIDSTEIEVQRRNATFAELAWLHKHYLGAAQLDVALANRWGVNWFNGDGDFAGREAGMATRRYTLQTLDLNLSVPFQLGGQVLRYTGTLHGQHTQTALYASEQLSMGNRYTVRGFDGEMNLSAERGFFIRNEIDVPLWDRRHSLYAALDAGKLYGPAVLNLLGDKLAGTALGLRGTLHGFSYDLFAGWALYKPQQFRAGKVVLGFGVVYQY